MQAHIRAIDTSHLSGESPMADISLHYSSKAPLAGTYTAFANVLQLWRRRARDRQELAKLDNRSLRELGLTESAARFEINKPFWRE
jgi:uncharacterized protein YjiS (DUF1127 family)